MKGFVLALLAAISIAAGELDSEFHNFLTFGIKHRQRYVDFLFFFFYTHNYT